MEFQNVVIYCRIKITYVIIRSHVCFIYLFIYFSDLCESNVNLKLTIVDSVGYGDQINKEARCVTRLVLWLGLIRFLFNFF